MKWIFLGVILLVVTFTWDMPTTNEDGTPIYDLAGARIYCGPAIGSYPDMVDVGNVTSYVDDGVLIPPKSERYCVMTAYDTSGNESVYSQEVGKDFLAPGAVINFQW